jgi:N-methylhydantoinase A
MGFRIAIDVGGTFTDFVYSDRSGVIRVVKTPSTPANQAIGVLDGLRKIAAAEGMELGELLGETELITHGTTVATNTMLEFNGARTGLITTNGFRDDIEIRRGFKERIFDPRYPAPVPIARRRHRLTVEERIDRQGKILTPLDEDQARSAVRRLEEAGIESIGVCLFFGFLNPVHEKRIAELIREEHPEAYISLSHRVLPQIREFERVSTTLVNAYTGPRLKRYLETLQEELRSCGFESDFFVMLSNGGIMGSAYAGDHAVYSLLSGPAGGVVACAQLIGELCGEPNLITVDMGGTSYDVSLIRDGKPTVTTDYWVSRYRVAVPMLDIHTMGAGGGSIAWVDKGGALQVGPQSAGAHPGPACYGRGGSEPTVTDANLVLGFLDPDSFLQGEMKLDVDAARGAIDEKIARPLGMDPLRAADGIFRIVNNAMCGGIRVVSVQRGYDPRDFTLVAFGGNGALHAGVQARELGIRKIIVPRTATAFSARGLLSSNIVVTKMRTFIGRSDGYDLEGMNALFAAMKAEAEQEVPTLGRESHGLAGRVEHGYQVDMHYKGETHEITVPLGSANGRVRASDVAAAVEAFHEAHESLHTFCNREDPAYLMNLRLEMIVRLEKSLENGSADAGEDPSASLRTSRPVFFDVETGFVETPVYDGSLTRTGNVFPGPCVIEELATTIVVYPGQTARLTALENYEITIDFRSTG